MCCIVRCPEVCLYPSLERLTLLTFILVKLLYDIGTGKDVWQAARVFWVFPHSWTICWKEIIRI